MRIEKRSSLEKVSIVIAVALIVIGVLWVFVSFVSAGVTPVDIDVRNEDEMVSVKQEFTTIATQRLTIVAMEIEVEMLAVTKSVKIEFETSADFADAIVMDESGEIVGSYEFARGEGEIDFSAGGKYTMIILSPGDDDNYGNNGDRQQFLRECEKHNARAKEQMIDIILGNSIEIAGSSDTAGVIIVKTRIVQPSIVNVSGEWCNGELEIAGQSNLPRYTEIEWQIFGETGATKARRNGEIDFDIDLEGIDTSADCVIEMRTGNWYDEFELATPPESTEPVMSIKPRATPTPTPRATPRPTLKPTPLPTQEIADLLEEEPVKESAKEAIAEVQRAEEETTEKSKLTEILETEVKWLPEIVIFIIAIAALLILRKKMKK